MYQKRGVFSSTQFFFVLMCIKMSSIFSWTEKKIPKKFMEKHEKYGIFRFFCQLVFLYSASFDILWRLIDRICSWFYCGLCSNDFNVHEDFTSYFLCWLINGKLWVIFIWIFFVVKKIKLEWILSLEYRITNWRIISQESEKSSRRQLQKKLL